MTEFCYFFYKETVFSVAETKVDKILDRVLLSYGGPFQAGQNSAFINGFQLVDIDCDNNSID